MYYHPSAADIAREQQLVGLLTQQRFIGLELPDYYLSPNALSTIFQAQPALASVNIAHSRLNVHFSIYNCDGLMQIIGSLSHLHHLGSLDITGVDFVQMNLGNSRRGLAHVVAQLPHLTQLRCGGFYRAHSDIGDFQSEDAHLNKGHKDYIAHLKVIRPSLTIVYSSVTVCCPNLVIDDGTSEPTLSDL